MMRTSRSVFGVSSRGVLAAMAASVVLAMLGPSICCAQDCNNNGVPDDQDIKDGTSEDCNSNGIPDECDIEDGQSQDCNENGVPDICDVASGYSTDFNGNEIPDECEPDCNNNGIPDELDIANGTSEDCQGNGLPDECEIASGLSPDCNGNGVPDLCDFLFGDGQDCNGNGLLDECDILSGTEQDCNENGIPDSCETDCNNNNIPDICDIESGFSGDCNGNGIPDECDIASGFSEDCDGNGVPDLCDSFDPELDCNDNGLLDECEVLFFQMQSGQIGPIGHLFPRTFQIDEVPSAGEEVVIEVQVMGDFGSPSESLTLALNDTPLATLFDEGGHDCPSQPDFDVVVLDPFLFNTLVPDGEADIKLTASEAVDPTPELCSSWVLISISYQAITENDTNGDGVLDECADMCFHDIAGDDFVVNTQDLLALLGAWGEPGPGAQFEAPFDVVDVADLLDLLSMWGPCENISP